MVNTAFFKKLSYLLYFTIIVFLTGDILRKVGIFISADFIRYTAVSKLIVLFAYLIVIITFFKIYINNTYSKGLLFCIILLLITFYLGQFFLRDYQGFFKIEGRNYLILTRYLFWPLTAAVFLPLFIDKNYDQKHLFFLERIVIINSIIIFIGLIFDIEIFRTYSNPNRFGFMGLFNTHNQASYYYISFILFNYYLIFFKKQNKTKFLIFVLTALLVGTKKIYLFLILLGLTHIIYFKVWKNRLFYLRAIAIIILVTVFFSYLKSLFINTFGLFIKIYNEKGLLSSLSSYRSDLLLKTVKNTIYENWTDQNYFFGGARFHVSRTEFELVDLYIFFGLFGFFAYYYLFRILFVLTKGDKFYLFILVMIGIISFFASGFLTSANQPIMFLLISSYFIGKKIVERQDLVKSFNSLEF
jgi:hypothetical protein